MSSFSCCRFALRLRKSIWQSLRLSGRFSIWTNRARKSREPKRSRDFRAIEPPRRRLRRKIGFKETEKGCWAATRFVRLSQLSLRKNAYYYRSKICFPAKIFPRIAFGNLASALAREISRLALG